MPLGESRKSQRTNGQFQSATLKTHWVLVVMDQSTRRIIGFGVHHGVVDGGALCRMLLRAIGSQRLPKYLSSDMIRYTDSIHGKRIFEYSKCGKSRRFLTYRCRIRLSND